MGQWAVPPPPFLLAHRCTCDNAASFIGMVRPGVSARHDRPVSLATDGWA